jgi:sugar/nucleoside kinase (ribokinase family)
MPITVTGSIAFDAVRTPFGESTRMLGGAAVHFALAASFFDRVHVVGCVGDDFGEEEMRVLRSRGVETADIEHVSGGKTFFWQGEYGWDLSSRKTLETELGVFAGFEPKLSEHSLQSDVLFLANIQPDLQRAVRAQMPDARVVALDSMNLWIDTARDSLVEAIGQVHVVVLNDAELRQLTDEPNLLAAAQAVLEWGPQAVVAKQGEYGAALVTRDGFFSLPAFPLENVVDPTGAGDTFAGGFLGYLAVHPERELTDEALRQAVACGTALASFNVEELGTERVERLTGDEIAARVAQLHQLTQFSVMPLPLRDDAGSGAPRPATAEARS